MGTAGPDKFVDRPVGALLAADADRPATVKLHFYTFGGLQGHVPTGRDQYAAAQS